MGRCGSLIAVWLLKRFLALPYAEATQAGKVFGCVIAI